MSDDLRDEVEKLKKKIDARAYQDRKEEAGSWTHRTREDLSALQTFLAAIGGFLRGLWEVLLPVGRGVAAVTPWLWRPVRALWNRLVYIEDEYKNRRLSKRRATYFVAASAVFAWFILIPLLGFLYDLGLYLATVKRDEVVYLTNSQEIMPEDNVHSVQGCYRAALHRREQLLFPHPRHLVQRGVVGGAWPRAVLPRLCRRFGPAQHQPMHDHLLWRCD